MIQFGTGGWRAIIADGFTKKNVQLLAQSLVLEMEQKNIVIGYDRRFLSNNAAMWLAEVFAGNDINVLFINKPVPTPIIMFALKNLGYDFGLAVTASHNPAIYNGVKIFTHGGRDATEVITQKLEANIKTIESVKTMPFDQALQAGRIVYYHPQNDYIDSILGFINQEAIRNAHLKVLVDTMYGVSKTSLSMILSTVRCEVDIINDRHDTLFGGKLPSPASSTLHKLRDLVVEGDYDLGVATDGDADRIGIIDERGTFIHPNLLISLIYQYLLKEKGWRGPAVRNLSTTHLLDRIAKKYDQKVIEVPVGFKHISAAMEEYDAIIGGESSGGLTIKGHIMGKDGIFAASLLVEMVAVTKKSISQLVRELYQEYGSLYNQERDYSFTQEDRLRMETLMFKEKQIPQFNKTVQSISYMDGLKVVFEDESWISARFSGTEPLLRIFSEASTQADSLESINCLEQFLEL